MAGDKGVNLQIQHPDNALITCDSNIISTVIRNLLTNAVKFTPAGGDVTLDISPKAGEMGEVRKYIISVSDTGTGMNAEQIARLFRLESAHSRPGTAGETGSGLGLIVCRDLLEKHGITLQIDSEEGKGSTFSFEI